MIGARPIPLKPEIAQSGMLVGPAAERPVKFTIGGDDRQVVDARDPPPHQALIVELPVLVAVAAEPVAGIIAPLIGEPDRDAILAKGPNLLDQAIVEFARPLARAPR